MSNATLARARQSLARGLEALQSADAPPSFTHVAQTLARALRTLVQIETDAVVPAASAESALDALREGLRLLQLPENVDHPAGALGMASVAEALGQVRQFAQSLGTAPVNAPASKAVSPPAAPLAPAPAARMSAQLKETLRAVEAALGAHSATNFYKGLASGDVVATGGLFVATYQVPPVGEKLRLKVSMPGGYEFEATGIVAWTRDVQLSTTSPGATPGFGAQFSEISDEGRGLIQRYVRNREPLFHDDL
jgi:Tfp pilus assembly protein PilZ